MTTASVGIRAVVASAPPLQIQLAWQRRLAFAIAVVVGSCLAAGVDEAGHWQRSTEVGLRVSHRHDCIVAVTPGGLADRAGVTPANVMLIHDTHEHWQTDRHFAELDGSLHVREGVRQLTIRVIPFSDAGTLCSRDHAWRGPLARGRDIVVDIAGPTSLARNPDEPWRTLPAVPFIVLFALLVGWLASTKPWHRDDVESLHRLRLYSYVLPAMATTALVPWWLHLTALTVLQLADDGAWYLYVVASTVPAWIALLAIAAKDASHHADNDFTTSSWRLMTVPVVPAALLVVPGIVVLLTSTILLRMLRAHHRRTIAHEAKKTEREAG